MYTYVHISIKVSGKNCYRWLLLHGRNLQIKTDYPAIRRGTKNSVDSIDKRFVGDSGQSSFLWLGLP